MMNVKKLIVCSSIFVSSQILADCSLPCGAEELITCAAQAVGKTAEQYYNTVLFSTPNLDGYCKAPLDTVNSSLLQQALYRSYCTEESKTLNGGYFSYTNFIAASRLFPEFACYPGTTKERRYKELSNFLTTIAQETTSAVSGYTNDGLYFRYENSVLLPGNCSSQDTCWQYPTAYYYQAAPYYVASSSSGSNITYDSSSPYSDQPTTDNSNATYTNRFWQPDPVPPSPSPFGYGGALYYVFSGSPVQLIYQWNNAPYTNAQAYTCSSAPCTLTEVNNTNMLPPALWIGMGAKQLTADTMFAFFGYYFQHPEIQENPAPNGFPTYTGSAINNANFYTFVNRFLVDGKLAFIGAFWYWMERINGQTTLGFRPIHQIVNDPNRPVCQDIATVTRMVNGGCNHYDRRLVYYKYFNSGFQIETKAIIEGNLNSLDCTQSLQSYCEKG